METILVGDLWCGRSVVGDFWSRLFCVTHQLKYDSIVSFLPPSTTIRRYQRRLLSTTCSELGTIYCAIVSYANTHRESEVQEIITSLIAIRSKLKRSLVLRTNVIYEVCIYFLASLMFIHLDVSTIYPSSRFEDAGLLSDTTKSWIFSCMSSFHYLMCQN